MPGDLVVGALVQNVWSYAGPSNAPDVNKFTFHYFVNYNLTNGWYLTSTPVMTADWEKPSFNQWFGASLAVVLEMVPSGA